MEQAGSYITPAVRGPDTGLKVETLEFEEDPLWLTPA